MYVTLIILFTMLLWAATCLGQKKSTSPDPALDTFQKRMQLREEIHRRMMAKLLRGIGDDEDLFKDLEQMMNESLKDSLSDMDSFQSFSFSGAGNNFQSEWIESKSGKTLVITPQSPEQKLDINVKDNFITIKGKSENKSQNMQNISEFSQSFNVPGDCDGSKVKMNQKDGKILVEFPYKNMKKVDLPSTPKKDERVPIPPREEDVTI